LLEDGVDLVDDLVHLVLEVLALGPGLRLFLGLAAALTPLGSPLLLLLWHSRHSSPGRGDERRHSRGAGRRRDLSAEARRSARRHPRLPPGVLRHAPSSP